MSTQLLPQRRLRKEDVWILPVEAHDIVLEYTQFMSIGEALLFFKNVSAIPIYTAVIYRVVTAASKLAAIVLQLC